MGKVNEETEYKNGLKHGKRILTFENGQKELELEFENGLLITKNIVLYHDNGKEHITGTFKKVEGINPCWKEFYINDSEFKTGIWNRYNKIGELLKSVNYEDDGEIKILFKDEGYMYGDIIF